MADMEDTKQGLSEQGENNEESTDSSENSMPSPQDEEAAMKRKYGGIMPKKAPLIAKDHERAYFDSADWALGKEAQHGRKPDSLIECLRPKLQPTPHRPHPSRRTAYATSKNEDGTENSCDEASS